MLYTIVAVLVLVLDQAVKYYAVQTIPLMEQKALIPGIIHLTHVRNTGAAFSILENSRWVLVGISVVFIVAIIVLISMEIIRTKFGRWTSVLVMAGALGNCIDRVLYGYVVDMFEVELFNFAVFNVADIFITICGILFCIHVIVYREPAEERNAVPRKQSGRRVREPEPELEPAEELEEEPAARSQRRSGKGRDRRQPKEDPYANIPKRGAHRSLEDELRLQNPDDPFAEWDFDGYAEAPKAARRAPAAPAADAGGDWAEPETRRPARGAAPAAQPRSAPAQSQRKQNIPDPGFEEYSLDDILSEFRDN